MAHAVLQAARRGIEDWAAGQTLEQAGFNPARVTAFRRLNEERGSERSAARRLLPLSVKTRLGFDSVVVESWVGHLLAEKPAVISLHGRTLGQMYHGTADWSAIARAASLVKGTGTLLLGNGDLNNLGEVVTRVHETGVDGVLVGRAVLGAPWFFRSKEQARALACGTDEVTLQSCSGETVSLDHRLAVLLDHARQFQMLYGSGQFYRMRKHLGWYCREFPHAAALRARMFRLSSTEELETVIADYRANRIGDRVEAKSIGDVRMRAS